jgi:hypothetical protein
MPHPAEDHGTLGKADPQSRVRNTFSLVPGSSLGLCLEVGVLVIHKETLGAHLSLC